MCRTIAMTLVVVSAGVVVFGCGGREVVYDRVGHAARDDIFEYELYPPRTGPYTSPVFVATLHTTPEYASKVFYRNGLYERGYYRDYYYGEANAEFSYFWGGHFANDYWGGLYYHRGAAVSRYYSRGPIEGSEIYLEN